MAADKPPLETYKLTVARVAESNPVETVFVVNGVVVCKSLASLKKLVGGFPPGSTLEWSQSCVISHHELFSSKDFAEFEAFCKEKKLKLIVHPAG